MLKWDRQRRVIWIWPSAVATGPTPTRRSVLSRDRQGAVTPAVALALISSFSACNLRQDPVPAIDTLLSKGKLDRALSLSERTLSTESHATRRYWELALRK